MLTWLFAPISYQVFQFRVAECLKSIVVKRKHLILAFAIGNAVSNIFSPFVGPWELLWMPLINIFGAGSAWLLGHKFGFKGMALGGFVYALWVAFGVSFMLFTLFNLPLSLTFIYLLIPEVILIAGFSPIMNQVNDRIIARVS
jgi:uncharacterized membrane protein